MVQLCDGLMDELQLSAGVACKVRRVLLTDLMHPRSFGEIAGAVNMSERTLRRKLREENSPSPGGPVANGNGHLDDRFHETTQLHLGVSIQECTARASHIFQLWKRSTVSARHGFDCRGDRRVAGLQRCRQLQTGVPPLDQGCAASVQRHFRQDCAVDLNCPKIGRIAPAVWPDSWIERSPTS